MDKKRRTKCQKIYNSLDEDKDKLIEQFPEYYEKWKEVKEISPESLSSQDFRFFVFIRECEKIK